jgi:hypothetical protein
MRTNKFKAVAVAISAALALALPFGVMAADGFASGDVTEASWDTEEYVAPVEEVVAADDFGFGTDFVAEFDDTNAGEPAGFAEAFDDFGADLGDASVGAEASTSEYTFYYHEAGYNDFDVYYDGKLIGTATTYKEYPADCENNASFIMSIDVGQDTILSEKFEYEETDPKYKKATGHKWSSVIAEDEGEGTVCTDAACPCETGVEIHYVEKCTVCGKYNPTAGQNKTGVEKVEEAASTSGIRIYEGHKWGEAKTVYLDADKNEIAAADATEESWVVTYKLCENKGCNHVQYDIKRNSSLEFLGYTAGENVESIPEDYDKYPLTADQYNDILLKNCTKDGKIIANFTSYEKLEQKVIDTNKELTAEEPTYTLFEIPGGSDLQITVPVPKHHTYKYKYVLADAKLANADAGMYINLLDKDGNPAVPDADGLYDLDTVIGTSKYCVDFDVLVIKTTVCNPANHSTKKAIETTEGTVTAKATPGSHFVKTELKYGTYPEKTTPPAAPTTITFADVKALKKNTNVEVTMDVTDCTKGGKGTAAYKCEFCSQAVASTKVDFNVAPEKQHAFTQLEMTEVVDATCTTEGSYIPVLTCENCGVKSTGTKQIIAKVPHKYDGVSAAKITVDGQIVVGDFWGTASGYKVGSTFNTIEEDGSVYVGMWLTSRIQYVPGAKISLTRKCTVCGQDIAIAQDKIKSLKATVTAVTKEGADGVYCKEGTITLKIDGTPNDGEKSLEAVSDEVTLRYYSSADEYYARYAAHTPGAVVKSNEVEPTETEAGGYDETISCIFCDKVISQRHVTIPALGHTHKMTEVPAKEATCTEAGNIAYYVCDSCGLKYKTEAGAVEDQLTDEEVIVAALGHEIDLVEAKDPTCVAGHAAYYVCTRCGEMFKDEAGTEKIAWEDVKIEPTEEHIPGDIVIETREDGKYKVQYCGRCGSPISEEPYTETAELLPAPASFKLTANKPLAGYMEFKIAEVEGAEKYRISYREAGTKPYTRQEADTNVVKIEGLERGKVYDFTACAGDVLEDETIQWGARVAKADGTVKYVRRWYETVEQSKIAKKGTVVTLEWTALADASKYVIMIADNKAMKNAVEIDAATLGATVVGGKVQVSADIKSVPGFASVPAGAQIKFYVRIRPYTEYEGKDVAGAKSNLRAKTIKF